MDDSNAESIVISSAHWGYAHRRQKIYLVGAGIPRSDSRPRMIAPSPPSPWYGPNVTALERELEATKRELRQALLELRALGVRRPRTTPGNRTEASEGPRKTGCDTTFGDLPSDLRRPVQAAAPVGGPSASTIASNLEVPHGRRPPTPDERVEATRDVERHLGPTDGQRLAIDDAPIHPAPRTVFVVVDDDLRDAVLAILRDGAMEAVDCASGEAFLRIDRRGSDACLLTDACLQGMGGLDLVDRLRAEGSLMPAIVITGRGDVPMAVRAIRAGVSDVIVKPVGRDALLTCVDRAMERAGEATRLVDLRADAARHVAGLTPRQREIMTSVLAGHPSKNIAADLGISRRTVENHRASIMRKTGTRSLPALARLALAAEPIG